MNRQGKHRGFTLVEMLAVIMIIGILAGLITAAAIAARTRAKKAAVRMEITGLVDAINQYNNKFGDYPPDFTDPAATRRHLAKAFPRCHPQNYPNFQGHTPLSALVYWLGGPDGRSGLSANPRNPFDESRSRIPPFYEFAPDRLKKLNGSGPLVYYPDIGVALNSCPYVYFRARDGQYDPSTQHANPQGGGRARPYKHYLEDEDGQVLVNDWVNSTSFQIICAGLDDSFGQGGEGGASQFPNGENYHEDEYDNITNFSNVTLEDEMP